MIRLFAGGFPRDLEEAELQEIFEQFGQVLAVKIIRDKNTAISRRFGFVDMATQEGADLAIAQLHGGSIDDDEISVTLADNRAEEKAKEKAKAKAKPVNFKGKRPGNKVASSYNKYGNSSSSNNRYSSGNGTGNNKYQKVSSTGGAPAREKRPRTKRY